MVLSDCVLGVNFRAKPEYFETVTNDFKKANPACPDLVRQGFNTLATWRTKPGGLKYISQVSQPSPLVCLTSNCSSCSSSTQSKRTL